MAKRRMLTHAPSGDGPLSGTLLILWHGAGGDIDHPHIEGLARSAAEEGAFSVRARFDYRVHAKRAPDRMPKLIEHAKETIARAREASGLEDARVVLGGRSMGGRMASLLAAEGANMDALVLLSYPLHPSKQEHKLRDEHLYGLRLPMIFVQGTRDALCRLELLRPVLSKIGPHARLVELEGADHGCARVPAPAVVDPVLEWLSAS